MDDRSSGAASAGTTRNCSSVKPHRCKRPAYTAKYLIVNFPVSQPDPGPSNGRLPTDPMQVNGPVVNRALLNQLYRDRRAAEHRDGPVRFARSPNARATQLSFGYERQIGATMSFGADYIRNEGRNWLGYDLNPGLRVNTSRTGTVNRTDLLGIANTLGLSPFANSLNLRYDYTGTTRYDGLNLSASIA